MGSEGVGGRLSWYGDFADILPGIVAAHASLDGRLAKAFKAVVELGQPEGYEEG